MSAGRAATGELGAPAPEAERLRNRLPQCFEACVDSYGPLLRRYVSELTSEHPKPKAAMVRLAERLGAAHAGPKDVVEIHTAALERCATRVSLGNSAVLVVEGRLFALEMMGLLADYYRIAYRRGATDGAA